MRLEQALERIRSCAKSRYERDSLWLQDLGLEEIPAELLQLTHLSSLALRGNNLRVLPAEIGNLKKLENLWLSDNQLEELPREIGHLKDLTCLDLKHNSLARLNREIGDLSKLKTLDVSHNSLAALPAEIGYLRDLRHLSLNDNQLSQLPIEIGQLNNLESLDLGNNRLTELPDELGRLSNLNSLLLDGNRLVERPELLSRLPKLETVSWKSPKPSEWDVFISHASEDKESVALPLTRALTQAGLKVWIDKQEIRLGDSIRGKIDSGLAKSRFGVVILSPSFVEKGWTQKELNALFAIEDEGEKVILPIWHNISKSMLTKFSPILSDRMAANTDDGIDAVASQIVDVVVYQGLDSPSNISPGLTYRFAQLLRDPASTEIDARDFVSKHLKIISEGFGNLGDCRSAHPDMLGNRFPDLLANLVSHATIPATSLVYLVFASPHDNTVSTIERRAGETSWGLALMETVKSHMRDESRNLNTVVVVAGRRNDLSELDKQKIGEFNAANRVSRDECRLELRTYDWLLDACVSADQFARTLHPALLTWR